ncbi:MAG: M18 family aminopeptidase [Acholeplasmatales bacterium]|nr:M18 family aminopeptidase [Acholeplasmatales bacterium]
MENVNKFINYLKTSTNAYEAVRSLKKLLDEKEFTELHEYESWKLEKGKNYYVTRNGSALIAFMLPNDISDLSFNMAAAHTDSTTFKIKPHNNIAVAKHYSMLNTEVYGGPIYSSFFDRPLSISGRIFVKDNGSIKEELINFDRDLLVIPNECIHFNRDVNSGKNYNPQIDLLPLLGKEATLESLIEKEFGYKSSDVLSYDLTLYSRYRGSVIGADKEYFLAPQIDDLESVYGLFEGVTAAKANKSVNVCIAFDNEEVGSETKQGANGTFLLDTLNRIKDSLGLTDEDLKVALAKSLMVSCDNAHAVHPNDVAKTDQINRVFMNEGIVVKHNANQHYATDGLSQAILKFIFDKGNIAYQDFTNRSDVRGGGTLGAISTTQVSIPTVDIGLAQLAMHSCIETAGTKDLDTLIKGMTAFFSSHITKKDNKIIIE